MLFQKIFAVSLILWMLFFQNANTGSLVKPQAKPAADNAAAAKPEELSPELKAKALKLLAAVARESQQYTLAENRIGTTIIVADLYWQYDEPEARGLFQTALADLQNRLTEISNVPEDASEADQSALYVKKYALSELRKQYLLTLAPRDPRAALAALLTLKTQKVGEGYDPLEDETLELQLATAIAKEEPAQAYELAKKQLADGISYNLLENLKALYKENPETAGKLARDIFAKLKTADIQLPNYNGNMSNTAGVSNTGGSSGSSKLTVDFWQAISFLTTAAELNKKGGQSKPKTAPLLAEGDMKELTELIAQKFLADRNPTPYLISSAMQTITQYAPSLAAQIRNKFTPEMRQQLDQMGEYGNYSYDEDKTADDFLAEAETAKPDQRDSRLSSGVYKAIEEGDVEKAQKIADKIKDKTSYKYVFDAIEAEVPLAKARSGDLKAVREMLTALSSNEERIKTLSQLATALAEKGDKDTAKKLLEEANQMLAGRVKKQTQLASSLEVATAYSVAAPDDSFLMLENNIAQMNDLISAGIMLEEFYDYGSMQDDELLYSAMNREALTNVANLTALFKNLAKADFDRAENLSEKFSRREIRALARLKLAQSLLDPKAAERETIERQQSQQGEHGD